MKRWMIVAVAAAVMTSACEAAHVVLKNGEPKKAIAIRAKADGSIVVTLAEPSGMQMTLTRDQYTQAVADKPAAYDAAIAAVQAKKFDEAIPVLQKIMTELRFLEWDKAAGLALAKAYQGKNDFDSTIKTYDALIKDYPALETDPEIGWAYRDAMIGAKQFARIEPMLAKLIAGESRADAARAQVLRGDIYAGQGKPEAAIRDYLRTILFFERESAVMPLALLRAAQGLEKLRDPRAKEFYRRLAEEYGDSPEAAQAKGKF